MTMTPLPGALRLLTLHGEAARPWIDPIARLRLTVFREWPYCYEGDLDYERDYLAHYLASPESVIGLVLEQDRALGATTGLPMSQAQPEMQAPFVRAGDTLSDWFYCGESVLLPTLRGHGIGGRFFDLREQQARALGHRQITFCAVERPDDHPLRPAHYRGNHGLWGRRGYQRQAHLQCQYRWKDLDQSEETDKTLTFWTRQLAP